MAAVIVVVVAADHIHHGEAAVQSARQGLSADGILSGAPVASLRSAESSFSSAHGLLSSPLLWPVDVLPVAGRQLRSVQDLSGAAEQVAHTGIGAVGRSQSLLRLPHSAGTGPRGGAAAARLAGGVHPPRPGGGRFGPCAGPHRPAGSTSGTPFSATSPRFRPPWRGRRTPLPPPPTILQGPGTYLLLAGNNAEMRSGSGAFLEAGIVTTGDGELHLSSMVPTTSLTLPPGAVTVTGDLAARWGWLLPGVDWRNLGLTPQFDVNGPLAASMWKANTGQTVDGVLAIDVQGLQELLEVTGPVTTSTGQVVSAATVDQLLLHDQYVGETYSSDSTDPGRRAVDARLRHPARAREPALQAAHHGRRALGRRRGAPRAPVVRRPADGGRLERRRRVRPAAAVLPDGRHHQPGREQAGPVPLGDRLPPADAAREQTDGSLTMTFANHTPPGQSPFIAGPYPGLGTVYGEYVGIATVNLPGDARDISSPSARSVVASGPEGPTILEGATMDILAGATQHITFNFVLPEAHGSMTVVPSARIRPATWHVAGPGGKHDIRGRARRTPSPGSESGVPRLPTPGRPRTPPGCSGTIRR